MRHPALLLCLVVATSARAAFPSPAPMPSVLRIGYAAPATGACAVPGAATPPALTAFAKHLAGRLQLGVQLCPFADAGAAAATLAAGGVDLASLTPDAWPAVRGKGRSILTLRAEGRLPRTPIDAIARSSAGKLDAAAIAAKRVVVIRQDPLSYDAARGAVTTHGGAALGPTPPAGSFNAAIGALGAGRADVALVPVNEWKAGCAANKALCASYRIAWTNRPLAESAWVLRAGLPDELRYRLIGIFLPMHLENRQAYVGAAGGVKGAFEPTEATALDSGGAGR